MDGDDNTTNGFPMINANGRAASVSIPATKELRELPLEEITPDDIQDNQDKEMDNLTVQPMDVCCPLDESDVGGIHENLNLHPHVHHHRRHHHSIYSRNYSYQGRRSSAAARVSCPPSVPTPVTTQCHPHHPSTCSMMISTSPTKRRSSVQISLTPPPPSFPSIGGRSPRVSYDGPSSTRVSLTGDRVDALPKEMSFSYIDMIAIIVSITTFLADIFTDIYVARIHYRNHDYWYFGLTTSFIVIPTLIVTGISLRWYVLDAREEGSPPISPWKWITRTVFLLLQLGPIIRYVDSLRYGLKFRRSQGANKRNEQKKYFQYMVYEDTDATMLRLFECFMEAAPQLVLQLYIMFKKTLVDYKKEESTRQTTWDVFIQVASVGASLVSLSWSLVSYHRALRMSLPDKENMSCPGLIVQFLWRICMISSRVVALALFATTFKQYIGVVCLFHWVIMFLWIISMRTCFCDNRCEELGYNAVLAVMFIFCYFNPVDAPTRRKYFLFYTITFIENSILMWLFYINSPGLILFHTDYDFKIPAVIGHFVAFVLGLFFMTVYYLKFHPTQNIQICRWGKMDGDVADVTDILDTLDGKSKDFSTENTPKKKRDNPGRDGNPGSNKKQISSTLWTPGRVLHPRPAVPNITSSSNPPSSNGRVNV